VIAHLDLALVLAEGKEVILFFTFDAALLVRGAAVVTLHLAVILVGFTPHAIPACTAALAWQALLQIAVLAGGTYGPLLLSLLSL